MAGRATTNDSGASRSPVASPPGFVARERELAVLDQALSVSPAVVLIEGEAGIGKSRLVQEFLVAPGVVARRVLVAGCPPFREPFTLGAVVDALRQTVESVRGLDLSALAGALRPLFPEWSADLPPALAPAEDATSARHRLFRALAELLDRLSVDVLVIEDVHWADEATVELLLFLAARRPPLSAVVVTYRPDDVPADSLLLRFTSRPPAGRLQRRIVLGPLDREGTARMVSSMLADERVSEAFASFLHQATEGLPLAIEESVRLLADRADLARQNGEWVRRRLDQIAVPPTIRDAVLERVARHSADAVTVLRAAATLFESTDESTLRAVAGPSAGDIRAGLAEALGSGLLIEGDGARVSFRHGLAARAVHEAIPAPLRRAMHLRAGQALEADGSRSPVHLVRHFREAGEIEPWCRYAATAADLALASGDDAAAIGLLHPVLVHGDLPAETAVRLTRKMPFHVLIGRARCAEVADALRAILRTGRLSSRHEAELRAQLGRVLYQMEDFDAGTAEVKRAIPGLRHDPIEAARCMTILGWPHGGDMTAAEHRRWLRRAALALATCDGVDAVRAQGNEATALLLMGDEAGWDVAARTVQLATARQDFSVLARAQANFGDVAVRWGRYADARQRLSDALAITQARDHPRLRDCVMITLAHLAWFTGDWSTLGERASALARRDDTLPVTGGEALLISALLQAATGQTALAEQNLQLVVEEAWRRGAAEGATEPAAALARLLLAAGRVDEALAVTDSAMGIVLRKRIWLWATELAPVRVDLLVAAGRVDEAGWLAGAFGRGVGRLAAPAAQAAVVLCRGIVAAGRGEHARAATFFGQASAAWAALPRPYDAALADRRQGDCLLAVGRDADAVAVLSTAHDTLRALGANADADQIAATLRAQGVRSPRRGGRQGYGDQLSPRELEVVRLLVPGRSNPEIAAALVLSPKTVARHLDSAMRKLRVSSRTALAVRAVETGLIDPGRR